MDDTIQGRGFFGCSGTIAPEGGPPRPGAPIETRAGREVRVAPYLVWITDGGATSGTTDPNRLAQAVADANTFGASLYAIGVGPDADVPLLSRIAAEHRGVARFAADPPEVDALVDELMARIADPVLVMPRIDLPLAQDAAPADLPDVAGGHDVLFAFRFDATGPVDLRLTGIRGADDFAASFQLDLPEADVRFPAVATAWAALRVHDLEAAALAGDEAALAELRDLAAAYGISSELVPLGFDFGDADAAMAAESTTSGCATAPLLAGGWPLAVAVLFWNRLRRRA
jgi:hypothetical protein